MSKITEFRKSGNLIIYTRRTDFDAYYIGKSTLKIIIKDDFKDYYGVDSFEISHHSIGEYNLGVKLNLIGMNINFILEYLRNNYKDNMVKYITKTNKITALRTNNRKNGSFINYIYVSQTDYDLEPITKNTVRVVFKPEFVEYYGTREYLIHNENISNEITSENITDILNNYKVEKIRDIIRERFKQQQLLANNNTQKSIIRQQKITGIDNELKPLNSNTEFDDFDFSDIEPVKKYDFEDFDFEEDKTTAMDFDFEEVIEPVAEAEDFEELPKPVVYEEDFSFEDDFIFDEPKKIDINLLKQELKEYFHIRHNEPEIVKYKPDRELLAKYEDLVKYILTMNEIQDNIDKIALCNEEIGKHEYQIHKNKIAIQELKNKSNELL